MANKIVSLDDTDWVIFRSRGLSSEFAVSAKTMAAVAEVLKYCYEYHCTLSVDFHENPNTGNIGWVASFEGFSAGGLADHPAQAIANMARELHSE